MNLTVITATHQRHALLAHCLREFQRQSLGGLVCEHLVVSDGPDQTARFLSERAGARYSELEWSRGHAGAFAKDRGIVEASGEYVCFWDDDNLYEPHALATLFAAAWGAGIGVVRAQHRLRKNQGVVTIPRTWTGLFRFGDVDSMCVCVRREHALRELWGDDCSDPGTDYRWLHKLEAHQSAIRYVPIVIGSHL